MFNQKGLDATSIHDITERADVGKGSFYRHFSGKDELKDELVGRAVENLVSRLGAYRGRWKDLPEAIDGLLQAHLAFFHESPNQFAMLFQDRLLIGQQQAKPDELEGPYLKYLQEVQGQLDPLTGRGVDAAKVRRFTHAIAGFISGNHSLAMVGLGDEDLREQLEPFRRGFVTAAANFLSINEDAGPATAASPTPAPQPAKEISRS
jgi:AcrR family transcriptional regulator